MDIVQNCRSQVKQSLDAIDKLCGPARDNEEESSHSYAENDNHINRILDQQNQITVMIERDAYHESLRSRIDEDNRAIEALRKCCNRIQQDAVQERQSLMQAQAIEVERFQTAQLKHITQDYTRHQQILEQRKKEIERLRIETDNEVKNRDANVTQLQKNLDKSLQERQQMMRGDIPMPSFSGITDEVVNPNHVECELTSIEVLNPYGSSNQRRGGNAARRGRGGSRRARGARA